MTANNNNNKGCNIHCGRILCLIRLSKYVDQCPCIKCLVVSMCCVECKARAKLFYKSIGIEDDSEEESLELEG
jgi:hypothetical protein